MAERVHITTAIIYSNGPPHVGHMLEVFAADTYARYMRQKLGAANVTFVTGTDEHGEKNKRAAEASGRTPKALADEVSAAFRKTWSDFGISHDYFVRTTDPAHEKFVQAVLGEVHQRGDIYFTDYEGLYCIGCERFYAEKELLEGLVCPTHNVPVETIKEGNYFLRIEKYRPSVVEHIRNNPQFIRPERYRNEALKMLAEPINDLCISRPKARMDWGIELPFDSKYVTYVWYDAFWAYVSPIAARDPGFMTQVFPTAQHFIGKDILKTHAVYWPAMLMAAGYPIYRNLNVHGWLNYGGSRMSKSSGNVADPVSFERVYGPDVLRYFLLREVVYGLDGDFSEERLIARYNADLANDLGNFTSRALTMAAKYFEGELTAAAGPGAAELDRAFAETFVQLPSLVAARVESLAFNRALETIWQALDSANKYVVQTAPFSLVKDSVAKPRVAQILANLLEGLRVMADNLEPFMPVTSGKILDLLNVDQTAAHAPFGQGLKPGHRVKPAVALFPRIESKS